MKNKINLIVFFTAVISLIACKKNEQNKEYKDAPRIMLDGAKSENATRDSTLFTFANEPISVTEHNLTLVAKISGQASDIDREYQIEVEADRTTAVSSEYTLPDKFIIRKGAFEGTAMIIIRKTPRMDNNSVKLSLRVVGNENFETSEKPFFSFVWSNDVIRPLTWGGSFEGYMGKYSKAKHRLMVSSTRYKDLNLIDTQKDFSLYGTVIFIRDQTLDALKTYNNAGLPPLLNDESTRKPINICRNCD